MSNLSSPQAENYRHTPRLYWDGQITGDSDYALDALKCHYLGSVMRLKLGAPCRIFNENDGEWLAEINQISKREGVLRVSRCLRKPYAAPDIWLGFAPLRRNRLAFLVEKATELGVGRLCPVITQYTQFDRLKPDKLRLHIIEAAEQTERMDLPKLSAAQSLEGFLEGWPPERILLFADEVDDSESLPAAEVLQSLKSQSPTPLTGLLIGPEGGFSPKERARLRELDFVRPLSLGPRILRAETAALSLLTLWQSGLGDWR